MSVRVPAKTRLKATVKELARLVDALPDPVCEVLEASGLLSSWRAQLETVAGAGRHVMTAGEVLRAAHRAVVQIQHVRGIR